MGVHAGDGLVDREGQLLSAGEHLLLLELQLRYFVTLVYLQLLLVDMVSGYFDEVVPFADVAVLALQFVIRMQFFLKEVLGFLSG